MRTKMARRWMSEYLAAQLDAVRDLIGKREHGQYYVEARECVDYHGMIEVWAVPDQGMSKEEFHFLIGGRADETVPRSVDRVLRELGMGCTEYWNDRVAAYGGNPALFSAQYAVADHPYVRSEMFGPNSRF